MSTSAQRRLAAQVAAHTRWSKTEDRRAATEAANRGRVAKWERLVDPDNELDPAERAKRAKNAEKAHLARIALRRQR